MTTTANGKAILDLSAYLASCLATSTAPTFAAVYAILSPAFGVVLPTEDEQNALFVTITAYCPGAYALGDTLITTSSGSYTQNPPTPQQSGIGGSRFNSIAAAMASNLAAFAAGTTGAMLTQAGLIGIVNAAWLAHDISMNLGSGKPSYIGPGFIEGFIGTPVPGTNVPADYQLQIICQLAVLAQAELQLVQVSDNFLLSEVLASLT
jgi:hypothetical protein